MEAAKFAPLEGTIHDFISEQEHEKKKRKKRKKESKDRQRRKAALNFFSKVRRAHES